MRILLVNAPARQLSDEPIIVPPLGLAYLAASARQAGHAVSILDAFAEGLTWTVFEERVRAARCDVIGLTGMTPIFDTVRRAIRLCRPHARTLLLGGAHATAFADSVLRENPDLDFAIAGEGEGTFVELLSALETGRSPEGIPGLITRYGAGPARPCLNDLDALPFPARDLLPMERYRYPLCGTARMTTMITSRGCPYSCIFCDKNVFGSRWRARSAENVLHEIEEVVERFGVKSVVFYDDLFTLDAKRVRAICEGLLRRPWRITWKAEGRVNLVDEELLRLMRRAGCDTIAYGVESANPHGLAYLRKNTTPDQIRNAFAATRRAGIKTMGYFILGIPVETWDDALRTIRFAADLKADYAQFSVLSPLPGTPLYTEAVAKGWYREIAAHNVSDKDLLRPAVVTEHWTPERLAAIVRLAHRRFYLRPSYVARTLFRARSARDLMALWKQGTNMVRYVLGVRPSSPDASDSE